MLRRNFVKNLTGLAAGLSLPALANAARIESIRENIADLQKLEIGDAVQQEVNWEQVRQAFPLAPNFINLNNAGLCPQPLLVQDAHHRNEVYHNMAPTYHARMFKTRRTHLRKSVAELAGCSTKEIALIRNTMEGMNNIIWGLDFEKGDEVILAKQDYSMVISAWKQLAKRKGVVLKWIDLKLPNESEADMVAIYANAFTKRTKAINITHLINWTGQILPVRKICDLARAQNIYSVVDGAQTFGHLDFNIPDLNCDFFAASFHKWLCGPSGTGMLYVRQEQIPKVWPLFPSDEADYGNIKKFENFGSYSYPAEQAVGEAIDFQTAIGSKLKEERLRYLKNYWCKEAIKIDRLTLNTSLKDEFSCAIAHFSMEGKGHQDIVTSLFLEELVHALRINWANIDGIRISPNIYTMPRDLDRLLDGLQRIAKL